jgi:DNA-binding NarL/FixJ family response regulator
MRVLLVEDNPVDADLLMDVLKGAPGCTLHREETLAGALARLGGARTEDLVLLDLSLPDATGLEALTRVRAAAPDLAVVVLTGLDDEATGVKALQFGAQDYLIKGQLDPRLLLRAFRYAVERTRFEETARRLEAERAAREAVERELAELRRLESEREGAEDAVARAVPDFAARYEALLEAALEEQAYKVERRAREGLKSLAAELVAAEAGPREIMQAHCRTLGRKAHDQEHPRSRAYHQVGRLVVIELLGLTLDGYRQRSKKRIAGHEKEA